MNRALAPADMVRRTIPYMYRKAKRFVGVKENETPEAVPTKAWEVMLAGGNSADGADEGDRQEQAAGSIGEGKTAGKIVVTIPAGTRASVVLDAGEEETGYLKLLLQGGAGSKISVFCSECYVLGDPADGAGIPNYLPPKGDRTDSENGYLSGYTDVYRPAGNGKAAEKKRGGAGKAGVAVLAAGTGRSGTAEPAAGCPEVYAPFWFRTFRYVRLTVETGEDPVDVLGFSYEETGYPLDVKTKVETSDPTLAGVWDISLRTLRRCMQETYTDCPFYEQLQYVMDARTQILYTYMTSADDRLARKCMRDIKKSQRWDGMINCDYPCYEPNVIPGFSIYYLLMLRDHMMFFGDKSFLREFTGTIDGILDYFDRRLDQKGYVGQTGGLNMIARYWSFIDWTSQWDETYGVPRAILRGPITMESLLYILGLQAAADIFDYLGRKSTAEEYRARSRKVQDAVNRCCRDEDGFYLDGPGVREYSVHCQVFALLTGTVSPEEGRKYLAASLEDPERFAQCSVAMCYYLFRALQMTGMYEKTDKVWEIWRQMVKNKLTTCVEDGVNGRSDCHAWGALALYELPAVTLGVQPAAPGYARVRIAPEAGYMTSASGDVITPKGMVHVDWHLEDGKMKLNCSVPEGLAVEES